MLKAMKKFVPAFLVSFSLLLSAVVPISADSIEINIDDLPGIQMVEGEDEVTFLIPTYLIEENPEEYAMLLGTLDEGIESQAASELGWFALIMIGVASMVVYSCLFERGPSNACSQVIHAITKPLITSLNINNKTTRLNVYRKYHSGKIPGCVPMNSGPCNSGYWEVKFAIA